MVPNQSPVKTKFEILEGIIVTQGEFINFATTKIDPSVKSDGPLNRFYKNNRIEFHTPCEHEGKSPCKLELQFYCAEQIDYTDPNPADKITNLSFALFFDASDKSEYFTDPWFVDSDG